MTILRGFVYLKKNDTVSIFSVIRMLSKSTINRLNLCSSKISPWLLRSVKWITQSQFSYLKCLINTDDAIAKIYLILKKLFFYFEDKWMLRYAQVF